MSTYLLIGISSRSGHVVIGGKGTNGQPLADVWVSPPGALPIIELHSEVFPGIRLQQPILVPGRYLIKSRFACYPRCSRRD